MAFFALVDKLSERLVVNRVPLIVHHRIGDVEKVLVGLLAPIERLQGDDELVCDGVSALNENRVEYAAFIVVNHFERFFVRERWLVTTLACECIVNICN